MGKAKIPFVIDKIEDGFVTLVTTVPDIILPQNAREGDVLVCGEEGRFYVDVEETRKRRKNSFELFEGLRDKD